jgi:hypothetical protein
MKILIQYRKLTALIALAAVFSLGFGSSSAQDITNLGEMVYSSTTPGPGSSSDYYYYGISSEQNLNDYATTADQPTSSGPYAEATAPGGTTSFGTGAVFDYSGTDLLTFSPNTAGSFDVYLLTDNVTEGNGFDTSSITITYGTNGSKTQSVTPAGSTDDYVGFNIADATAGEVFTVYTNGGGPSTFEAIGGVTFGPSTSAPEPSTYALLLGGLVLLAVGFRRRSA